jgi:hypothetical protein
MVQRHGAFAFCSPLGPGAVLRSLLLCQREAEGSASVLLPCHRGGSCGNLWALATAVVIQAVGEEGGVIRNGCASFVQPGQRGERS